MMILISSTILSELVLYQTEALQIANKRRQSTLNELVILLVSYCFLIFDILEVEANFKSGYVPIAVVSAYIVISLVKIMISTILSAKLRVKVYCVKRRYGKSRAEL